MNKSTPTVTEFALRRDLNELAHSLVRDLAMACKKMAIYGAGHPLSFKAVEKPFAALQAIFQYKARINMNVLRGTLYVLNISVKDTVFSVQFLQYLQLLDVSNLIFERSITPHQLGHFVDKLVCRTNLHDSRFHLARSLREKDIDTIRVNTETGFNLFDTHKQYRGEFDDDFSLRRIVLDQLGNDLCRLARIYAATDEELPAYDIDFNPEIVRYLIPERIAGFDARTFRRELMSLVDRIGQTDGATDSQDAASDYMAAFRLVDYHPDRDTIIENLDTARDLVPTPPEDEDAGSPPAGIKVESQSRVERFLDDMFVGDGRNCRFEDFAEAFRRLLTTGQRDKALEVSERLTDLLSSPDQDFRQKSLGLLLSILATSADKAVTAHLVDAVVERVRTQRETYEYSEIIWRLFTESLRSRRYRHLAKLAASLADRCKVVGDIRVYDSMAIKKSHENINCREVIETLVTELIEAKSGRASEIKKILVAIGSEEVALALASIITHPTRAVRQQSLKILAELGKASLKVFTTILNDDSYFSRDQGRHELPDARWYVVRNSIFVLGSLGDPEGIVPLRLRLSDADVRVRREIVAALEKIGGEDAIDCLIFMAEDVDREIREAAVIAIGLVGDADSTALLIDLLRRNGAEALKAITALGKLGGDEARGFLSSLLKDDKEISEIGGGRTSREDLRAAVVRALGQIGDPESIDKVKEFQAGQTSDQGHLSKNTSIKQAIAEVLGKR